jgi:hypothetical protein
MLAALVIVLPAYVFLLSESLQIVIRTEISCAEQGER